MADTYEQNLGQKSSLTANDFIRVVGSDNVSYKQNVGGVASVIKSLNSAITNGNELAERDLNNFVNTDIIQFDLLTSAMTNAPETGTYFSGFLFVNRYAGNKTLQRFYQGGSKGQVYVRMLWNGTWGQWYKEPTREEIDALNTSVKTYTPTFSWSDGTALTVDNVVFSYAKSGNLLWISGRFHIADKGSPVNATLRISLPFAVKGVNIPPAVIGTFVPSNPDLNSNILIVRLMTSSQLGISYGAGGNYPSSIITNQYYTLFAVVPIE